jgi:hypothetical protein
MLRISVGETRASSNLVQCNIFFWLLIPILLRILLPGLTPAQPLPRPHSHYSDSSDCSPALQSCPVPFLGPHAYWLTMPCLCPPSYDISPILSYDIPPSCDIFPSCEILCLQCHRISRMPCLDVSLFGIKLHLIDDINHDANCMALDKR